MIESYPSCQVKVNKIVKEQNNEVVWHSGL